MRSRKQYIEACITFCATSAIVLANKLVEELKTMAFQVRELHLEQGGEEADVPYWMNASGVQYSDQQIKERAEQIDKIINELFGK